MQRVGSEDWQLWVFFLQFSVHVAMQFRVRPPLVLTRTKDFIYLDSNGEIVGLERLDAAPAIIQVSLLDQRIVITLPTQLDRKRRRAFLRQLKIATPR